jgi:CTP:molybdopterin cytidylyltransferase MocA
MILAAGMSSRFKPYHKALSPPLGPGLLAAAALRLKPLGLLDKLVVAGFRGEEVRAEAESLGLRTVSNPNYMDGMFSSVKTGIRGIEKADAVFILPVDAAFISSQSLLAIFSAWASLPAYLSPNVALVPSFQGRLGHPPILGWALAQEALSYEGQGGLRGFLSSGLSPAMAQSFQRVEIPLGSDMPNYNPESRLVILELGDNSVLCDIDCQEDLEKASSLRSQLSNRPSSSQALLLLSLSDLTPQKKAHSMAVAIRALRLALALEKAGQAVDPHQAYFTGLLHDLDRYQSRHAAKSRDRLMALGWKEAGLLVGAHTDLPLSVLSRLRLPEHLARPDEDTSFGLDYIALSQASIGSLLCLFMADKYSSGSRLVDLEGRFGPAFSEFAGDSLALETIQRRYDTARVVERYLTGLINTPKVFGQGLLPLCDTPSGHPLELEAISFIKKRVS